MEIERKFLVEYGDEVKDLIEKYNDSKKSIVQDYIYSDLFTAIRKRKIKKAGNIKYVYTVKTSRTGQYSVNEIEKEITEDEYNLLKKDESRITIEKDRFFIPYNDGLTIELDVFHGAYEGVIFAEIEFSSENEAKKTAVPSWFGKEVGDKISNDMMSKEFIDVNAL